MSTTEQQSRQTQQQPGESEAFACPDCGGTEFLLTYHRPLTQQELNEAPAEVLGLLALVADDSQLYAQCARGCEFCTSVTNIELTLAPKVT